MEQLIQDISESWIPLEQLENLKLQYEKQIDSPRLLSRIHTLDGFLYALQQRDILSGENTVPLGKICSELCNKTITDELQRCKYMRLCKNYDNQNLYASQRIKDSIIFGQLKNRINTRSVNQQYHEKVDSTKRNAIYKLIASDIGRKWREFGRNLGIKEGDMDDLDNQFPKDFKSKVYGLFKILEDDLEGHQKYVAIHRALDECRRTDLKRKLDDILNT